MKKTDYRGQITGDRKSQGILPVTRNLQLVRCVRGFTLVETMVAITVMTLATLAPFAAVQQVLRATNLSRGELVAASLAQEGIEYIRFVRYTNYLRDGATYKPLAGIDGTGSTGLNCLGARKCYVDAKVDPYVGTTLKGVTKCAGSSQQNCNAPLYRTPEGLYTQETAGNEKTPYTRTISATNTVFTPYKNYITVTATVTWEDRGPQSITITENMYDWF